MSGRTFLSLLTYINSLQWVAVITTFVFSINKHDNS